MIEGHDISYVLHEVSCKCREPLSSGFIVFSEINIEDGSLKEKCAKCPFCGAIHKIKEIHESVLVDDIDGCKYRTVSSFDGKFSDKISSVLNNFDCDVYIYECIEHLKDSRRSGNIVIKKEIKDDGAVKYIVMSINEDGKFTIFESESDSPIIEGNIND